MSSPGRVLLVDDDPKVLRLLEATLRLRDYDVVKMESATQALAWLEDEVPDLILADIMMPELDGYEFYRRVRSETSASQVPFVFLSARGEPGDVVRGLRLGADEFLRKPFSIDELLVRVERVLGQSRPPEEAASGLERSSRGSLEGDLQLMPFADLARMLCVQESTGVLRVTPEGLRTEASLAFREGQLVHAEFGRVQGEAVIFQLLMHSGGRFSFRPSEALEGETISRETLPLLMEGFGLQEQGILEVLDPDDSAAIAALEARVESSRSSRPDPPPVRAGSVAAGDEDSAAAALRLTKGRPPPGLEGQLAPPTDLGDFSDTIAGDAGALRPLSDELPTLDAMLASRERAVTDVSSTDGPGPDTWERSGVLDTAQLGAVSSGGSSVGADSEDRVPAFVSDEIRTLEGDLESGELELGDPLELSLGSEGREEDSSGGRLILDSSSGAVALVEDSMYRVPPLEMSAEVTPADLMAVYEGLKVVARSELGTRAVQLGTRSGRVLVSAIPEEDRRAAIGAFSAQAIAFASEDSSGLQYAVLDAGGLHVLVVEVDPRRVFTLLFDSAPDPEHVLALVRPVLSRWRSDLVP